MTRNEFRIYDFVGYGMFELVHEAFKRNTNYLGQPITGWRCMQPNCGQVELTWERVKLHLAVVHGIRPIDPLRLKELKDNGIEIQQS